MSDEQKEPFEHWCIVELFGHQKLAGKVTELVLAGTGFLRIEVPAADGSFVTRLQSPKSVYGIIPCTEEIARAQAKLLNNVYPVKPVDWAPLLPSRHDEEDDRYEPDSEEDDRYEPDSEEDDRYEPDSEEDGS